MTNSSDLLSIDTPENVTFDYDVAGIGSRFLAALVDSLLVGLGIGLIAITAVLLRAQLNLSDESTWYWILAIASTLIFLLFWGYYILFEIFWNGQTPGKRWVKIRVIRVDGTPVSPAEVVIRNLLRVIDLFPTAYAFGVVCMFLNDKSRRLGDLAAGTLVVHEREAVGLVETGASRERALSTVIARGEAPGDFPYERLSGRDVQVIEEYLLRRNQLPNSEQLAGHILSSIYSRLDLPETSIPIGKASDTLAAMYKKLQPEHPAEP
jgi:uncharacterized RDD family membrane protein YckC